MPISENTSLRLFNSFGIDVMARYFASFSTIGEFEEIRKEISFRKNLSKLILGGGSNILFTKDYDGLVLKNELKGIELIREDEEYFYVKVAAGENWHQFTQYCIHHNYAGVENLSLIPGNIGASPIQNIGAYGVEIKDVFYALEALHLAENNLHAFSLNDCNFSYRDSIFKSKYREQYLILNITLKLNKKPIYHTHYWAIEQELEKMGSPELSIKIISEAVIRIRNSKLPHPSKIGNAGSFFKNPVIPSKQFTELIKAFPEIPGFQLNNLKTKIAAGWLIEKCGWKGYRKNEVGCYEKQALVLVNYGSANGMDVFNLSEEIITSVREKFNIILEREVNIF